MLPSSSLTGRLTLGAFVEAGGADRLERPQPDEGAEPGRPRRGYSAASAEVFGLFAAMVRMLLRWVTNFSGPS